jgi:hypothetical protein
LLVVAIFSVSLGSLLPETDSPSPDAAGEESVPDASRADGTTGPCPLRDEGEGEGEGEPEAEGGAGAAGPAGRYLRHVLPLAAAALVVALAIPATRRRIDRGKATAILVVCAVVAVGTYAVLERSHDGRFVNGWEFFHYYLGSKYAPELGYTGLYAAALVADEETGREFRHERDAIRNLEDGGCIAVDDVLRGSESVKSRFSPDRWAEFTQDVRYFKGVLSPSRWNGVFRDKGYNATPVWTMIAAPLTSRVPTSNPMGLLGLSLLDPLLLILAVVAVWRTFGTRPALLMVVLIGTHMTMSHSHMKGALLRTDWVTSLVLAVCAVKAKRPAVGGVLVAISAALRVFPALFALGLLVAWARGPRRRSQLRFVVGFLVTLGLVLALSALVAVPGTWTGFADKIWQHHDSFSPWRVGFKQVFLGAYEYLPDGLGTHQEVFREGWVLWWAIQGLMLGALSFLTRRLENWERLALGFVPVFFLVAPTYYYYMMLVIPLLFFYGRIPRPECTLGVVWLLASSSIAYVVQDAVGRELPLFYALSLIALAVCALMSFSAWREVERQSVAELEPAPTATTPIRVGPYQWSAVPGHGSQARWPARGSRRPAAPTTRP